MNDEFCNSNLLYRTRKLLEEMDYKRRIALDLINEEVKLAGGDLYEYNLWRGVPEDFVPPSSPGFNPLPDVRPPRVDEDTVMKLYEEEGQEAARQYVRATLAIIGVPQPKTIKLETSFTQGWTDPRGVYGSST